ncbi:MAG: hypothetical protein R3D85_02475 [Paracoccaceae bacterium]
MKRAVLPILAALTATACAEVPALDGTVPPALERADYPMLVPVEPILAAAGEVQIQPETEAGIRARVARLKARAARLRGPIVDGGTRARMRAGVTGIVEE